ncbi:MAG: phosphonate ABC transporter, permease protein PhnE [Gemmobacter sp.]|uniref:phosphonate ABC transporter, permease protein PhnE n=1 Tax=Gemmobacter sp. TaxID=1898957 RepID=UPI00391ADE27
MADIRSTLLARARGLGPERQALIHPGWQRHVVPAGVTLAMAGLFVYSLDRFGFSFARIWNGLEQLGYIVSFMLPPDAKGNFPAFAKALGETVAIALLGTLLGAILAFPLSLLAARNVMTSRIVQFMSRRLFDGVRGIDTLIWALIYVNVVGLGPFAGVLAIASSDMAGFAKVYSEAMEATERNASEGVRSTGGNRWDEIAFGLLPQVMPVLISQILYFFESNTRSATIIGIVGAGGIGLFLSDTIRTGEWQQVSVIILMILVVVSVIDLISTRLRFAIIGKRG